MRVHELKKELWVPKPINEVFEFFSNAGNLELLTPPWLRFQTVTRGPIQMKEGTLIDYRLFVRGIPLRWQSEITVWDPPRRFIDEQRRGPYRFWRHEHTFEERDGGTLCSDCVHYAIPFDLIARHWVKRDVQTIFNFRTEKLRERFGA